MYSHEIELGKHTLIRKGMERKNFLNDLIWFGRVGRGSHGILKHASVKTLYIGVIFWVAAKDGMSGGLDVGFSVVMDLTTKSGSSTYKRIKIQMDVIMFSLPWGT